MIPKLSTEIEAAVRTHHGSVQVEGDHGSYVVLSLDMYRELLAVEEDQDATLRAIDEGLADAAAGRTRPVRQVIADIRARHGVPG